MAIKLAGFLFTGPVEVDTAEVRKNQDPAIWAIVSRSGQDWDPAFHLVDLGETGEAGLKFAQHPHRDAWRNASPGPHAVYLLSVPRGEGAAERSRILSAIRASFDLSRGPQPIRP